MQKRDDQIACVWLPHFLWQLETAAGPDSGDAPTVVIGKSGLTPGSDLAVLDFSPEMRGLEPGMPVGQAKALHGRERFVEVDELRAEDAFDSVVRSLQSVAPEVESGGFGLVYANLRGTERLYGSSRGAVAAIARSIESEPYRDLRIGIGPNKWLAYVTATKSAPRVALRLSGAVSDFLYPLPLSLLPVAYQLKDRFRQFYFKTMADIARLPIGPFQAQFGPEGKLAWEFANGMDNRPFVPLETVERVTRSADIEPPTIMLPMVLATLESLFTQAFSDRSLKGRHTRTASVSLKCSERGLMRIRAAFHSPVSATAQAMKVIEPKVTAAAFEAPVEMAQVTLFNLTSEAGRQASLLPDVRQQDTLKETFAQIRAATGAEVYWIRDTDPCSLLPEERTILVPTSL
jgi:nucleotidyltransferase/DNA polymerase involved in DNA repair